MREANLLVEDSSQKQHILHEVFELLNERYPMGLYEYVYKYKPEISKIKDSIEERIDEAFLTSTVDVFKAVLREYWALHMEMIREFKNTEHSQLELSLARKEYVEQRLQA